MTNDPTSTQPEPPGDRASLGSRAGAPAGEGVEASDTSLSLLVLLPLLLIVQIATFAVFFGTLQVLVPNQIAAIDPAHKLVLFGTVTGIAAIVAAISNPVAGALSDRTRGRFGRRSPWLVLGGLATAAALVLLGNAGSIALIATGMATAQVGANCVLAAIGAVMPERVAMAARGRASAVIALGIPLGGWVGVNLASSLSAMPLAAYGALGGLIAGATMIFVLVARERPYRSRPLPTPAATPGQRFAGALVHADFRWTFISRFVFLIGVFMINNYELYLLQDAIRLPSGASPTGVLADLVTIHTFFLILATLVGGWASDRVGRRKPFVIGGALCVMAAVIAPIISPDLAGMRVMTAVLGLGLGCYIVVDAALITQVLPNAENAARDLGILNIASAGPQVVAPLAASAIVLSFGSYDALFVAAGSLALISAAAILRVRGVR